MPEDHSTVAAPRPTPDFVIAGAARAGTTSLAEQLRAHPDLFLSTPKEPHYLAFAAGGADFTGPGDDVTVNRVSVTDPEAYAGLFAGARPDQLTGDASVSTLYYPDAAAETLLARNPAAKLIVVLRDPVDRAYSSFQYLRNRGFETLEDFAEALAYEDDRREQGWHHLWHYTAMSRYAVGVGHFLETFGPDQVGVWWYDDVVADPAGTLAQVHRFLGVDPIAPPDLGRVNSSGAPRSRLVASAMHAAARSEGLRRVVKAAIPFGARERIRNANLRSQGVAPQIRAGLLARFTEDLDALEAILERPVPEAWRR